MEEYSEYQLIDSTEPWTQFEGLKKKFIKQLVGNMKKRFPNEDISLLSATATLDMEKLPSEVGPAEHGIEKLELLLDHYGERQLQTQVRKSGCY